MSEQGGFIFGLLDGFATVFDFVGVLLQAFFQKLGYDIRTIGGISFFEGSKRFLLIRYHDTGHLLGKLFVIVYGGGSCLCNLIALCFGTSNASAVSQDPVVMSLLTRGFPTMAAGLFLINIIINVYRYKVEGHLKK